MVPPVGVFQELPAPGPSPPPHSLTQHQPKCSPNPHLHESLLAKQPGSPCKHTPISLPHTEASCSWEARPPPCGACRGVPLRESCPGGRGEPVTGHRNKAACLVTGPTKWSSHPAYPHLPRDRVVLQPRWTVHHSRLQDSSGRRSFNHAI